VAKDCPAPLVTVPSPVHGCCSQQPADTGVSGASPSPSLVFIPAIIDPLDTAKKSDLIKNAYFFQPPAQHHEN